MKQGKLDTKILGWWLTSVSTVRKDRTHRQTDFLRLEDGYGQELGTYAVSFQHHIPVYAIPEKHECHLDEQAFVS